MLICFNVSMMQLLDTKVVRLPSSDASIGEDWRSWDAVNPYASAWARPSGKAKADWTWGGYMYRRMFR